MGYVTERRKKKLMDVQAVFAVVNSWPAEDRVRLLEHIWDNLADEHVSPAISDKLRADLDRRCDELDRHTDDVVQWQAVEARACQRFST